MSLYNKKAAYYALDMTSDNPYHSPNRFLDVARNDKLRGIHGSFGDKILEILENAGIHTFGDLLDYSARNYFSDLPGIGAHGAERIHQFIEFAEKRNKGVLDLKLQKTERALEQETDDKTKRR